MAMSPARILMPWKVLEMEFHNKNHTSNNGNKVILAVVDRANRFPLSYSMPCKVLGVALLLSGLNLAFVVPVAIRSDARAEFTASFMIHLCRWIGTGVIYRSADHP